MVGTGEYTTGWVGKKSDSDKSTGVVALVMLDLKQRGKVGRLGMCGTNGTKLPAIRAHMRSALGDVYEGIDPAVVETFPADDVVDRAAYAGAVQSFAPGDCAIIFTPDDTHFDIAMACIERGVHVMITKPPVKTLAEHNALAAAAAKAGVLCVIEVHKRFDPIYRDARDRIRSLGAFSFFQAYMSQPKPGQEKGDSTSLQRGRSRSNCREESIPALLSPREMIARPKMSQHEWKNDRDRRF